MFYLPFTLSGLVPSTNARLIRTVGVAFVKLYLRYVRELSLPMKLQLGKPHFGQLWVLCKLLKVWQVLIISEAVHLRAILPA